MTKVTLSGLLLALKDIFSQSKLINGKFFVLKSINDLNTTNFGQLAFDNLTGLREQDKFPCCLLKPPVKIKTNDQKGWGTYKLQMFVLVLNGRNTNGDTKNADLQTNLSLQTYTNDWNDTNIIADDFFNALSKYCQDPAVNFAIHEKKDSRVYDFKSAIGADNVNGVHVSFEVRIWEGDNCNASADYLNPIVVNVIDFAPDTLSKQ